MKYLLEEGCPGRESVCESAANNLEVLQFVHKQGCVWDVRCSTEAARSGNMQTLQYALENGCPAAPNLCTVAAAHLPCLQYLHTQGHRWNEDTCRAAVISGKVDSLQYLHEQGCPWYSNILWSAVTVGETECVKYIHQQGGVLEKRTC